MLQESTAQRGSFASANILNDLELQVMDQFKSFYTEIEQTTIEQVRYKPTSLEDAEQQFEKTYLQQQLADNKGIQSRVGNYRTIHRLAQKHDLEAKAFDLVTFLHCLAIMTANSHS